MNLRQLIIIFFILSSSSSRADWVIVGASFKCDQKNNSFSLKPTVETSSPKYNVTAPSGYTKLKKGFSQSVECQLGTDNVKLLISVNGPQERGMGQGAGVIIIEKLLFNNKNFIDRPLNFNWQVMNEKVLTELHLKNESKSQRLDLCYSNGWDWDSAYGELKCETKIIPNG